MLYLLVRGSHLSYSLFSVTFKDKSHNIIQWLGFNEIYFHIIQRERSEPKSLFYYHKVAFHYYKVPFSLFSPRLGFGFFRFLSFYLNLFQFLAHYPIQLIRIQLPGFDLGEYFGSSSPTNWLLIYLMTLDLSLSYCTHSILDASNSAN